MFGCLTDSEVVDNEIKRSLHLLVVRLSANVLSKDLHPTCWEYSTIIYKLQIGSARYLSNQQPLTSGNGLAVTSTYSATSTRSSYPLKDRLQSMRNVPA